MLFVIAGVLIIASNLAGIGPFASWNWAFAGDLWKFCVPFGLAALWWVYADKTGLNKRREMAKMEQRKEDRRRENLEALGLKYTSSGKKKSRKEQRYLEARQRTIDKIEGKRAEKRQKARDSVIASRFDGQSTVHGDDTKH